MDTYTHLHMEAACCIWEAMLEGRDKKIDPIVWMDRTWEARGTVEMRHAAISLGPVACQVWDLMSEDEQQDYIPYDWEFIPEFVSAIEWDEWMVRCHSEADPQEILDIIRSTKR